MDKKEFETICIEAEAYFNRQLAMKDISALQFITKELEFSFDLTEYLLEYCASIKKTTPAYYEKVARNWYAEEIKTREDAKKMCESRAAGGKCYLIAKDYRKPGCLALETKRGQITAALVKYLALRMMERNIQILTVTNMDTFSEYKPYNIISSESEFISRVLKM